MRSVPKALLASVIVWTSISAFFRLIGFQSDVAKLAVVWSFGFSICCALFGAFHYVFSVDLQQAYSKREVNFSGGDVLIILSSLIGMFVGMPLSIPILKTSEGFSSVFTSATALLFFLIVAWIGRMLFHANKTARLFMKGGSIDKNENQKLYRFYYCCLVLVASIFVGMGSLLLVILVNK